MTLHNFIFTTASPGKYYRHITYWLSRILLQSFGIGYLLTTKPLWDFMLSQIAFRSGIVVLEIVFTYPVIYYFIPVYFNKKKYLKFSIATTGLVLLTYCIFCFYVFGVNNIPEDQKVVTFWHYSMFFLHQSVLAGCAIFLTLKILKDYYKKMEEKATLAKENADAELQLLKAQVHPHFLFNTINNIYAFMLTKPAVAEELVSKLSDTLRYMIKDCDTALVPLEKELKILQDYIGLEKVRYGNRISIGIKINGDPSGKLISPLLMIPFVENSFKHGTSQMLSESWIKMEITIADNNLLFSLRNSKPFQNKYNNGKNGLGLENVKKRLQLIYPLTHKLNIDAGDNIFSVKMSVPLSGEKQVDEFPVENARKTGAFTELNPVI